MTFEELSTREVCLVVNQLPEIVRAQMRREDVVLAGGIIRDTVAGLPVKDVDIFCHSAEQAERLAMEASPFVKHTMFAYSVELGIPVQYVFYKDFTGAQDLISQFDFRACCAGVYADEAGCWQGISVDGFHTDCADKVLRFMAQQKDAGKLTALGRALKFAKRGWTLPVDQAADIIIHWQESTTAVFELDRTYKREAVVHSFSPQYGRL